MSIGGARPTVNYLGNGIPGCKGSRAPLTTSTTLTLAALDLVHPARRTENTGVSHPRDDIRERHRRPEARQRRARDQHSEQARWNLEAGDNGQVCDQGKLCSARAGDRVAEDDAGA